jgi:hypothetical protein
MLRLPVSLIRFRSENKVEKDNSKEKSVGPNSVIL